MDKDAFLDIFADSIKAITDIRYFRNERGYQARLITEMTSRTNIEPIFPSNAICEQEYQKTLKNHGINIRPDIIIHVPYEQGIYGNRRSGNFVVIQLKLSASLRDARKDFDKLDLMFHKLDYPLGIFLNINSPKTFHNFYTGAYSERLYCFAVRVIDHEVVIYMNNRGGIANGH